MTWIAGNIEFFCLCSHRWQNMHVSKRSQFNRPHGTQIVMAWSYLSFGWEKYKHVCFPSTFWIPIFISVSTSFYAPSNLFDLLLSETDLFPPKSARQRLHPARPWSNRSIQVRRRVALCYRPHHTKDFPLLYCLLGTTESIVTSTTLIANDYRRTYLSNPTGVQRCVQYWSPPSKSFYLGRLLFERHWDLPRSMSARNP